MGSTGITFIQIELKHGLSQKFERFCFFGGDTLRGLDPLCRKLKAYVVERFFESEAK